MGEFASDGVWYETGLLDEDDMYTERRIQLETPIVGKVFRVITDKMHTKGYGHERWTFDLLAT